MLLREHGATVTRRLSFDFPNFGPDEVDDALQRGLGKAWKHATSYKPEKAPLRAWFYVICRRIAVDVLAERAKSGGEQIEEWATLPDERSGETNPVAEILREVIETLAPLQRAVIENDLADPSGVAPAERIAQEVGTTAGAVYNARKKAKRAIEKRLKRRGIDGENLSRGPGASADDETDGQIQGGES